tara:strand:+ start:262 stop:792 length:531 start_codon:yes stop_codon:yes gene_type:complete
MSWLRRLSKKYNAPFFVAMIVVLMNASCGFTPVYKQASQNHTQNYLNLIEVAPIAGKRGVQLRNRLEQKIYQTGYKQAPLYRLSVDLSSSTEAVLIQLDNTATRHNLKMDASFILSEISTGTQLYTAKAVSVGSYNVVDSEFAAIVAEDNAAERAAREISEEILVLLVVFFSRFDS